MRKIVNQRICRNCGRRVFGFWRYEPNSGVCSLDCLRSLINRGIISKLDNTYSYPNLRISPPEKVRYKDGRK